MDCRLLFGAALAVLTGAALAACGGSSSETPPPLQPDPAGFRYAPTSSRQAAEVSDAGDAPGTTPVGTATDPKAAPRSAEQ